MQLSDLPVGSLVKDTGTTYNGKPIIWRVLEHNHSGDPTDTTALECRDIITLKCFDAIEANNSDSNRKSYGNNRYLYSNILQWLNSDAAAGTWYTAKHTADTAPTDANVYSNYNEYDKEKGFLANFSTELKNALQTVSKVTAKNTVTDGGGYENVNSKIFLLSTTEVGLDNENSVAEGSIYAYYSTNNTDAQRVKKPTAKAVSSSEDAVPGMSTNSGWYWWLRTPYSGSSAHVRHVDADGSLFNTTAYRGNRGVSPACTVPSSLYVSETTDADGCYVLSFPVVVNNAPTISPASKTFGFVSTFPTLSITVTDADEDTYSGVIKLDGTQKSTFSGTSTGTHTVPISEWWSSLSNGNHTITVTVTDSKDSTTNTYTFTKFDNDYNVLSLQNLEFILNKIKSLENRIDSLE